MRGKHTQAAAVRHEVQSRDAEIETYKNAVARLTAETKALRAARETDQQSAAKVRRELSARLDAGAAPKVEALELLLAQTRDERDTARRAYEHLHRTIGPDMLKLCIDVMRGNGVPGSVVDSFLAQVTTVNDPSPVERIQRKKTLNNRHPEHSPDVAW